MAAQSTFDLDSAAAVAGQVYDMRDAVIISRPASAYVPFGRVVVEDSNGAVAVPGAASLVKVAGIALRSPARAQDLAGGSAGYAAGEMVPILRQGACYACFDGGTDAAYDPARVKHADTTTTHRGKLTASAASTASDAQITDPGMFLFIKGLADSALCLVEVNLGTRGATGATGPTGPTGP